jgi:hypothetical protein
MTHVPDLQALGRGMQICAKKIILKRKVSLSYDFKHQTFWPILKAMQNTS